MSANASLNERTEPLRVAIYARVSTDKQDNGNQLLQLREFCLRQRWEIVNEFCDTVSGSGKKDRINFERMMLAASQKQFDVLVFWSLDRLSREGIVKILGYLEQLRGWGVGWRSFTQPFLDTGNEMVNGIVLSVLAAVAKQERITISERTKAGLVRARKAGKQLGRSAIHVDVKAARKLQAEGLGVRGVAARLGISVNTLQKAFHR
jgi:DNA invertase Pin-like site-specific DNA recombinase